MKIAICDDDNLSFPTRERGLKYSMRENDHCLDLVVPHEGTWIEISSSEQFHFVLLSFPTRERGLKYGYNISSILENGRSPRGNVD